ncbi:bifunctional metallophosphatase/5'-nucleotidase [Mycoplasmopsis primatum]|uniref:bifunctional metallophosphatase/5'-nucleotidase n=1 Tax=Mycoplasmopsis primatum TaxID=55604 RepID=UPI000495A3BE|nr:bifunctional UDP-sugar hydrolase/5'-nucleotidase [Mycoplasmopsis primatum]
MKRKLWLSLGSVSVLAPLTLIAASCNKNNKDNNNDEVKDTLKEAKIAYENAYKSFNEALEKDVKELKAKKKAINSEEDKAKIEKLEEERNSWVKTRTPILKDLRKEANEKYLALKKAQKGASQQLIKVFHTNDEHGRLLFDDGKYNNYSGMQSIAEIIGADFDRDLLLSAGDLIQGLPLSDSDKGMTISKVTKAMGYHAVAVGNHEFDYGLEHLFNIQKATEGMPFLSANVVWNKKAADEKVKTLAGKDAIEGERVFEPYIIKELDSGIKVGIMGITTPDTQWTSNPKNSVNVKFLDPVESGNKAALELKEKGVNFVIALTHLGVDRPDTNWDSRTFANKIKNVDLVLDGHSHTLVPVEKSKNSESVYLTQTECYTKYLSELDITLDTKSGEVLNINQKLRPIEEIELLGGREIKNQEIKKYIDDLKVEFDKIYSVTVLKNSPIEFRHTDEFKVKNSNGKETVAWLGRTNQTNLGMFSSDAIAWDFIENNPKVEGKTVEYTLDNVIGLFNGGGLRANLEKGKKITKGDILGIAPFGNRIAAVAVKGSTLLEVMKHGALKTFAGAFAQYSSNVKANINLKSETDGKRTYEIDEASIKINDKAIDVNKDYYIVTNDFILVGGDGYTMLDYVKNPTKAKSIYEGGDLIESLIKYMQLISVEPFVTSTNPFGKRDLKSYSHDTFTKNVVVKHEL